MLRKDHFSAMVGGRWLVLRLLALVLLLGGAHSAHAGTDFCSSYPLVGGFHVIDGNDPSLNVLTLPSSIGIDSNCYFKNFRVSAKWPQGLTSTLNFKSDGFLAIFENVYYSGNMACAVTTTKIWFVNNAQYDPNNSCQSLFIPVETVGKQAPGPTAAVGVPFTYTLTVPVMYDPATQTYYFQPSVNTLSNATIYDDLTATGASLTYVSNTAFLVNGATRTPLGPLTLGASAATMSALSIPASDNTKHIVFSSDFNPALTNVAAGTQVEIQMTVVLDNVFANVAGTQFTNTAKWWFGRVIDGVAYTPLPGQSGVSAPMTIVEPNLTLLKTSPITNLNVGTPAPFKLNVQNTGGSDAWNAIITDVFPTGMCAYDPTPTVTARVFASDGATPVSGVLVAGTDYTVAYSGCQLNLTMLSAAAKIAPTQRLIVNYQARLDASTAPGLTFTNAAGATQWYSGASSNAGRRQYNRSLTNGTPGTLDFQDAYTVTSTTQGYFFLKSVGDLTNGVPVATTAYPGDRLRYTLQIQNFTYPTLSNVTITDDLDALNATAAFVPGTLALASSNLPVGVTLTVNPTGGSKGTGSITISGLNLLQDQQYQVQFDITLASGLANGTNVVNQGSLTGTDQFNVVWTGVSDDPYINGPSLLSASGDSTPLQIYAPGALSKANTQATAAIGQPFKYRITVPATPVNVPLYDVRILDNLGLSAAKLSFVSASVVSGGTWSLTNTGTATNLVIQDTNTGIDIPAGGQAVIDITVALQNTPTNQNGLTFTNSASYTYNKINGDNATQGIGGGATTANMTVVEPALSIAKAVSYFSPAGKLVTDPAAAGDVLQYTVTVTNNGTSPAYDTDVIDAMPSNLSLVAGSATATINSVAISSFVAAPTVLPGGALVWGAQNGDGNLDIPAGGTLVLSYRATVLSANGTPITNSVYTDWASLNGGVVGERNGAGCPNVTAPDIYCAGPAISTVTAIDPTAFAKAVASDTWATAPSTASDATLRAGDTAVYTLTATLREGTTQNVVIADTLPPGMAFDGVVSINGDATSPYSSVAPFTYSDFTGPAVSGNTVTWSFGNITNAVDNVAANNGFVIQYRARVVNTLAQLPTSQLLTNNATLNYAIGGVAAAPKTANAPINVWQPLLSVSKSAAPAAGGTVLASGELVTYTVNIQNTGTAPAYNPMLQDILPLGMRDATPVTVSITLVNAGTTLPSLAPTYNSATGVAIWNLTSGVANQYAIPAGETLRIVYRAQTDASLSAGMTLTNQALVQHYYSLDSTDPNAATRKDYGATPVQSVTLTTAPAAALSKQALVSTAAIGQPFTYRITVPATPQPTALHDVRVLDDLAATGVSLSYTSASARLISNTKTWATLTNTGSATSLVLQDITAGAGLDIPAGDQLVVDVVVVLKDDPINNTAGKQFTNTANYTYNSTNNDNTTQANGAPGASGLVTIAAPVLSISKNAAPAGGGTVIASSELVTYTVDVRNTGTAPAYDTLVQDTLPLGMRNTTPVTVSITLVTAGTTLPSLAPTYNSTTGVAIWNLNSGVYAIPAGETLRIKYQAQADASLSAGMTLTNQALVLHYYSQVSTDPNAKAYGPTGTASATLTTASATALAKQALVSTAAIGQPFTYRIKVPATPQLTALHDVRVLDDIGLAATGVSLTYMSASARLISNTKTWATLTNTGSATSLVLQDITAGAGLDIPAGDQLVVDVVVVLNNDPVNNTAGKQFTNTANYTYNSTNNDNTTQANGAPGASGPVTIAAPNLSVLKTAAPAAGGTVIASGELVTYTVDVRNTGTAPAYNPVLQDILPAGMRNTTPVTVSITLVNAGTTLPSLAPTYNSATGVAIWNLTSGVANQYAIPAGETLRIVYRAQADASLSAGMTLTNQALVQHYYSLDSTDPNAATRKDYGATPAQSVTLTTAPAIALAKQALVSTAAIGQPFTYRITVPATPQPTALHDVRVLDDIGLAATGVSLSYTSASARLISNTKTWATLTNTGSATSLVLQDTTAGAGLDIPAGDQLIVDVVLILNNDIANNTAGKQFSNTANYTYNSVNNDNTKQANGSPGASGPITIVAPNLIMQKSGPASMRFGVPGTFTLNVQNTGLSTAWNVVLSDILPNVTTAPAGGMCGTAPTNVTARVYQADGTTPVAAALVNGSDFTVSFAPAPSCTLTVNLLTAVAAIAPTNRLIVTYSASLDAGSSTGINLTNVAGATQWLSADPGVAGTSGYIHNFTSALTNGTPGVPDFQDAYAIMTEAPVLEFRKTVLNVTTGQNPGASAHPGDVLRYTVTIKNVSTLAVSNFSLTDDLDRLNATAMFVRGSLTLVTVPAGATTALTSATGGAKGTGLVNIGNLSIGAMGAANDNLTVVFEARLALVINNAAAVLNQAQLPTIAVPPLNSDDPNVNGPDNPAVIGDEDPTRTVIASAPAWLVKKTSQDMTGDPLVLMAGDRLHYAITVKNVGTENAVNVSLRDMLPANTTYVAGSTQLNGVAVADIGGASALQAGMLIDAPENLTPGAMRADASTTTSNDATVTFDVLVNANVFGGTIISNQGFVNGSGAASGVFLEKPSDDPATATIPDDPTCNVVGKLPLLIAQKTVALQTDANANGIVDPLDVVRYTMTISNLASIPATGVVLTDLVPVNTAYVANTATLNGAPLGQPDGGVSPLISGAAVNSPAGAPGTIAPKDSAVVTFDVRVNAGVAPGAVISNQGTVGSNELPAQLTDVDGNSSNGYQPTTIVVGSAQQVAITKQVSVVGGGAALPGAQLEYLVTVTNTGTVAASNVVLTDDLSLAPLTTQVTYVAGSGTLNGSTIGVNIAGGVLTADYAAIHGNLQPGTTAQLRFRVVVATGLAMGSTITNTGQVAWNVPTLTATANASVSVGGIPGTADLNGHVWHDANLNKAIDGTERNLAGWAVDVYRNNTRLGSVTTDANGVFSVTGLAPSSTAADQYSLRFIAPGATVTTAKLGRADSTYINGLQAIDGITALSGSNIQDLNLPVTPNGATYDSILRTPVTGATLRMVRSGSAVPLPQTCFDDPAQQGQVTLASGYYKFDLNFSDPACPTGADYLVQVTPPSTYVPGQSLIIPPLTDATTPTFSVPSCPGSAADAVPATAAYCEAQPSEFAPSLAVPANAAGTNYYLHMTLNNAVIPGSSQIFNNHVAIDPRLDNAVSITKVSSLQNVTRGQLVPYTITVNNTLPVTLSNIGIVDTFPPGFKYVAGSGRLDGVPAEPTANGNRLVWGNLQLATNTKRVIQLMLVVGSGVAEGKYVNRAQVFNTLSGGAASPEASATVRVIPDPTLDCSDVIGKVFDDANLNGYQDEGEQGLQGVRVATARGLLVTTDKYGRFHLACAVVPDPDRGSNFILKVDDRTLPSGYRLTTENPRVQRATRGKMLKFDFGAAIHKVVTLDLADGVFEPGSTEIRVQWKQRFDLLLGELKKAASVLRVSYLAETEDEGLVNERLKIVKQEIARLWKLNKGDYDLTIETEVFWRTGAPPGKSVIND